MMLGHYPRHQLQRQQRGDGGQGAVDLTAEFADYRDVAGVKFPFRVTNYSGEKKIAETTVTEIGINREMPDSLFQP